MVSICEYNSWDRINTHLVNFISVISRDSVRELTISSSQQAENIGMNIL